MAIIKYTKNDIDSQIHAVSVAEFTMVCERENLQEFKRTGFPMGCYAMFLKDYTIALQDWQNAKCLLLEMQQHAID
jgi:hypothetical protein